MLKCLLPVSVALAGNITVTVSPATRPILRRGRVAARGAAEAFAEASPGDDLGKTDAGWESFVLSVAQSTIAAWSGDGVTDGDAVADVTPENIAALLSLDGPFDAFVAKVINPATVADAEKNASAPLSAGSTPATAPTATSALPASATAATA